MYYTVLLKDTVSFEDRYCRCSTGGNTLESDGGRCNAEEIRLTLEDLRPYHTPLV
jgi:hypothetical protein